MARSRRSPDLEVLIPPPVGGVNIATAIDKLSEVEAEQLRGYEFDEHGVLGAPRAPKPLGTILAAQTVLSAHVFQRISGATQLIVHLTDGSLRYSTDFHTTATTATWTTIATGLSATAPFDMITFLDKVWMGNGVNTFRSWDGAASATYAGAPLGRSLEVWKDIMWMSNGSDATVGHRVYSSAPGDPTTWPALNFIDVGKGQGLGITALFAVEAALIVFKPLRTHIIYDPVEYTNRVIDANKGCLGNRAVTMHNGTCYFVSHLGVCRFLGDGPSEIVSARIGPVFDDLFSFGTVLGTQFFDTSDETNIWAYSFENYVGFYLPNNLISQYIKYFPDLPDEPWVFGTPMDLTSLSGRACLVTNREGGKYQQLYKVSGSPAVLTREYGGLLSEIVNCEWRSPWFDFDLPITEKYISQLTILHRGDITVILNRDYRNEEQGGEDSEIQAVGVSAPLAKLSESILYTDYYARQVQIVIQSTTAEETKQMIASGLASPAAITRFQSSIARVHVKARRLSDQRR